MKTTKLRIDRQAPWAQRVLWALRRSVPGRLLYRARWRRRADVVVISYPKAGRTWLRALLTDAIARHVGLEARDALDLRTLCRHPGVPRIRFKHDDAPQLKTANELVRRKDEYRDVSVVLLVRDPRDLLVSLYFQMTRRENRFEGDLPTFLREARGSTTTLIAFMNTWMREKEVPQRLHLLRYEDLRRDPEAELARVLAFCGVENVASETLRGAVETASFERMRALEKSGAAESARLRPADPEDPESFKTRRGEVGGYRNYLNEKEIEELEHRLRAELDPAFGYSS